MGTYCINRIYPGEPERTVMEIEANSVGTAWLGVKSWFIEGTFYVFPKGEYGSGTQYTKEVLCDYERTAW